MVVYCSRSSRRIESFRLSGAGWNVRLMMACEMGCCGSRVVVCFLPFAGPSGLPNVLISPDAKASRDPLRTRRSTSLRWRCRHRAPWAANHPSCSNQSERRSQTVIRTGKPKGRPPGLEHELKRSNRAREGSWPPSLFTDDKSYQLQSNETYLGYVDLSVESDSSHRTFHQAIYTGTLRSGLGACSFSVGLRPQRP